MSLQKFWIFLIQNLYKTIEINCHIHIFDKKYQNFIKNLRHKNRVHAVKLAV